MLYFTLKGAEGVVNALRSRNIKRSHFKAQKGLGGIANLMSKAARDNYWVIFKLNDSRFWGPFKTQDEAESVADLIFSVIKAQGAR